MMQQSSYGLDVSWPIHHPSVRPRLSLGVGGKQQEDDPDLGDRQSVYDAYVNGCRVHYGAAKGSACDTTERDRVRLNKSQPASMQNYTSLGFKKVRAPQMLYDSLLDFWDKHGGTKQVDEVWPSGNTYVNYWENPTSMVSIKDVSLVGGMDVMTHASGVLPILESWSSTSLTPTHIYGIRVYKSGAILAPHIDRHPLVISAIICVAADVDEPWPLEVYSHDGQAYNVTMLPGDMVLYESHTVLHGRPFPLKGRFVANIFVHFEPEGHSQGRTNDSGEEGNDDAAAKARGRPKQRQTRGEMSEELRRKKEREEEEWEAKNAHRRKNKKREEGAAEL